MVAGKVKSQRKSKTQLTAGLWCFTRLKRRSARCQWWARADPLTTPLGALLRRRRAGSASWELGGELGELGAGTRAGELVRAGGKRVRRLGADRKRASWELNYKFNKAEAESGCEELVLKI